MANRTTNNVNLYTRVQKNMQSFLRARKRGRPLETVEMTDIESDSLFPHIPMASSWSDGQANGGSSSQQPTGVGRDLNSIVLLMFLYVLQGIPLGLAGSIPMLLQSRKVSYTEQAIFSFVYWPFSVKLLWAPLVDSLYSSWFGRRKTWLIPIQYLMGLFMLVLSTQVKALLGDSGDPASPQGHVNIYLLTAIFVGLNFLAATQDIAVDGWALTMLSKDNLGWASTCNSVGQTAGYFLGNVLFLSLESADFCNTYLRWEPHHEGLVTLSGFLWFWGVVFFVTTTLVGLFKSEHMDLEVDPDQGIVSTYRMLGNVICLPSIISYCLILLTAKITFAASDALTGLKMLEAGLPKERLALFAVPLVPVQIALPLVISKYTSGPQPMAIWLKAYPFRMLIGLLYCLAVYWATVGQTSPGEFPWYFYVVVLGLYALHQVAVYCMFVSQMAFHAKVSDPTIGGTYMTLLNTVANLGSNWPNPIILSLVDYTTWKSCSTGGDCDSKEALAMCDQAGGSCSTSVEGYYILTVACTLFGLAWLSRASSRLRRLGHLDPQAWKYQAPGSSSATTGTPAVTS